MIADYIAPLNPTLLATGGLENPQPVEEDENKPVAQKDVSTNNAPEAINSSTHPTAP
ncbi:MAG: hypothetical protein LBH85_00740 [Treponema sp.]|jgi:hypothetical protein|nr:hypothetical protein [Treponema sp.]